MLLHPSKPQRAGVSKAFQAGAQCHPRVCSPVEPSQLPGDQLGEPQGPPIWQPSRAAPLGLRAEPVSRERL